MKDLMAGLGRSGSGQSGFGGSEMREGRHAERWVSYESYSYILT